MRFIQHLFLALTLCFAVAAPAMAAEAEKKVEMQLVRNTEGAFASVALQFALPEQIEDALYKGVALYFVEEAEIISERWYWRDKTVQKATRYLRLSYQPLTRRWRLAQSAAPFAATGLGVSLDQSFDDLPEVLAALERIARWKIAEEGVIDEGQSYLVNFQFRLDMSQLPRPLQIGAVGGSSWNIALARGARLSAQEATG